MKVTKGDVVATGDWAFLCKPQDTERKAKEVKVCDRRFCLTPLTGPLEAIQQYQGMLLNMKDTSICTFECGEVYCSEECRIRRLHEEGHGILCSKRSEKAAELRRHALRTSETLLFVAELLVGSAFSIPNTDNFFTHESSPSVRYGESYVEEGWILLLACYPGLRETLKGGIDEYRFLVAHLDRWLLPISINSPACGYLHHIQHTAPPQERLELCKKLLPLLPRDLVGNSCNASNLEAADRIIATAVKLEESKDLFPLAIQLALPLLPLPEPIPVLPFHSCLPLFQFEGVKDSGRQGGDLKLNVVALRDGDTDVEGVSVAVIDIRQSRMARWSSLGMKCGCDRCATDTSRPNSLDLVAAIAKQAMELGLLVEALGAWKCVTDFSTQALNNNNFQEEEGIDSTTQIYGDAWCHIGALHMARGHVELARSAWRSGAKRFPFHKELAVQSSKEAMYANLPKQDPNSSMHPSFPSYTEIVYKKAFVTTESLLSASECAMILSAAEEHAVSHGGWTTSRHSHMSTTDLPVHEVPIALEVSRELLGKRLLPLMRHQFGWSAEELSTSYVHDLFVVRYTAEGGQRLLPLHRDESTCTAVIALNSQDEYRGGGTWLQDCSKTIIPGLGCALTFVGGSMWHAGDPISWGQRYILALFLFPQTSSLMDHSQSRIGDVETVQPIFKQKKLFNAATTAHVSGRSDFSFAFRVD